MSIGMQNIEEQALATYSKTLPLWLRYVGDTITAVHESRIDEFHEHLNEQNTNIHFNKEIEENGKIPFLDCLVTRENNNIRRNDSSNNSYTTTATIPYVRGTSETIARILRPYNIRVAHKPIFTLPLLLTHVSGKDKPEDRPGAVYKIHCSDCQATYIGETGRNLTTRLTEHKRATKTGDLNNNIAEHHLKTNHAIDWDSAACLTYSTDYYQRITLESWFTTLEQTALNRCQPLSAPYKRLLNRKHKHLVCYSFYNPYIWITYLRTCLHSQSHHVLTNGYSIY